MTKEEPPQFIKNFVESLGTKMPPRFSDESLIVLRAFLQNHNPEECADWVVDLSHQIHLAVHEETMLSQTPQENVALGVLLGMMFNRMARMKDQWIFHAFDEEGAKVQ